MEFSFNDFKAYVLNEMKSTNEMEVMVTDSESIKYDCDEQKKSLNNPLAEYYVAKQCLQ